MCGVILENCPFFQQMFSDRFLHQSQMLQMDMMESFWGPDHVLNIFWKCSGLPVVSFKMGGDAHDTHLEKAALVALEWREGCEE